MRTPAQSTKTPPPRAFSAMELLVIIAAIAVLAVIFLPALARSKAPPSRMNCANNLKQIGLSFRTWALDNDDHFPMQVSVTNFGTMEFIPSGAVYPHFQVMSNELSTPKTLLCPNDEKRTPATNFTTGLTDRNLSYFVNMDATNWDGSTLLSGDRNITNRAPVGGHLVLLTKGNSIGWTKDIHQKKGYLAFTDGSVNSFSNGSVDAALHLAAGTTNRLVVP